METRTHHGAGDTHTLAMNFGAVYMLGIDLQQLAVATLIIALELWSMCRWSPGDGTKRALAEGLPRRVAVWLGPTKLATAIFFATITNVIAYLPFLMLTGNTAQFLRSLPIVMTASPLCALAVAMNFIPLLGYYVQRPLKKELSIEEKRERGFMVFTTDLSVARLHIAGASCSVPRVSGSGCLRC